MTIEQTLKDWMESTAKQLQEGRWLLTVKFRTFRNRSRYVTDAELIDLAKEEGWEG